MSLLTNHRVLCALGWAACAAPPSEWQGRVPGVSGVPAACGPGVVALLNGDPFLALQDAWDAAGDNALIEICPGVWEESVVDYGGAVRGRLVTSASGSREDTILRGSPRDYTFLFVDVVGLSVTFKSLSFVDGNAAIGSGYSSYVYVPGSSVVIDDCEFSSAFQMEQGLVYIRSESVSITNSYFDNKYKSFGASVSLSYSYSATYEGNHSYFFNIGASYQKYPNTEDSMLSASNNIFTGASLDIGWSGDAHHIATLSNNVFTEHVEDAFARGADNGAALTVRVDDGAQVDLDVSDSLFDANFGYDAAHVELERDPLEEAGVSYLDATFTRTTFWRGGWAAGWIPDFDSPGEDGVIVGSAIGLNSHNRSLDLHFEDVDFGTGPTANYARTIDLCPERREGMYTGSYSYPTPRQSCPW